VTAFLFLLGGRRTAAIANLLAGIGIFLIGFNSYSFSIMLIWLFIFSLGQHIFLSLNLSLGLDLVPQKEQEPRPGLFAGSLNLATIIGSLTISIGFSILHFNSQISYLIAAIFFFIFIAGIFLFPAGLTGVFFRQILGHLVDRLGERFVLAGEAFLLIFAGLSCGLAEKLFSFAIALTHNQSS